ncbi:MAG: polyhydroxyalkanoic acid system family protein [Sandaracinaceae bacterium]
MGIKHEIRHGLEPELARHAINHAMDGYRERFADFQPTFEWMNPDVGSFSFTALAVTTRGSLEIEGPLIYVDVEVPFLLRPFKGKAIDVIDREVRRWVDKAKNGDLDDELARDAEKKSAE